MTVTLYNSEIAREERPPYNPLSTIPELARSPVSFEIGLEAPSFTKNVVIVVRALIAPIESKAKVSKSLLLC